MTNFKRTRCVIYAITQHDSTAENSPRTSITGKNTKRLPPLKKQLKT